MDDSERIADSPMFIGALKGWREVLHQPVYKFIIGTGRGGMKSFGTPGEPLLGLCERWHGR